MLRQFSLPASVLRVTRKQQRLHQLVSIFFCIWLVLLVCPALAQNERRIPVREGSNAQKTPEVPAKESHASPLPAKKLEEALRMLLQADSSQTQRRQTAGIESQGLVVDQTISKIGRDFYSVFYTTFEAPPGVNEYNITITELPARGNSALVSLAVNDETLLEIPLQPKYDLIEEAAIQAVGLASDYLVEAQRVSNQLERGELKGRETY
ncbi:CsgE family curli-type amyloid fiber assembly protein [Hymenobacter canadensis]|uniref:Curli production assembly/transport component CsgE n=1 Tax=Hymenobacter canadensis TaxID=2999067 RepID=A0ABY7LT51_9BACT|nr:CsgE family curli-type amyloid fiber assembly protein [Hymenobacter canadensis]WBA43581.1 CsgE family curli-type amyloid fiber assembly protein [Hymenobacter canadensis]